MNILATIGFRLKGGKKVPQAFFFPDGSHFYLIIWTFIKGKKLRNNRRTISPANISNNSRKVGLITRKSPSETTSQLSRSMGCTITVSTNPTKFTTQKILISKLFLMKGEIDQCTCFSFELIGTRESIQIFASPSTIIQSHFSQEQFEEWIIAASACEGEHNS